jgi:O-antigen ligase
MGKTIGSSADDREQILPLSGLMERSQGSKGRLSETWIFVALIIFSPVIEGGTTHLPVVIIRLLLLVGLAVWFYRSSCSGSMRIHRIRLLAPISAFVLLAGLGILHSSYVAVSIQGLVGLVMYGVCVFLVLHLVCTYASLRILIIVILSMGLLEGLLGIVQFMSLGEERARGTFFNPNFFATYEAVTLLLSLSLLLWMKWPEHGWKEKCFLGAALTISLPAFVMAESRGAFIALLVALLFLGFCRSWKLAFLLPVVVLLGVFTFPNPIKQRVMTVSERDPYAYTRFEVWKNSLDRIVDHPFGAGLGTYKYLSFKYRFPIEDEIMRYGKRAESAHNEYLQMAVEVGVGGLALFLVGVGIWGWEVKTAFQGELSSWGKGALIGLAGGAIAILVHATVDSVFHEPALVLLLILCGSCVLVLKRLNGPSVLTWIVPFPYHPVRSALIVLFALASALLIIQPAAAWFAYERGNVASRNGRSEIAWEWYRRANLIDPGTTAYRDALARMNVAQFSASGNPQWIIEAVEQMIICQELNPLDGRIPSRLGMLYLLLAERAVSGEQQNDLVMRAVRFYERAIEVDPFSPFNYLELGKIMWRQGHIDEAQAVLAKAIAYEPNFLPARVLLAKLAEQVGKADIAKSEYAAIEHVQKLYKNRVVSYMEHQYLDVDSGFSDRLTKE